MLTHIVWWTMKPEADGHSGMENAQRLKDALKALSGRIPSLLDITVSMDLLSSTTEELQLVLITRHNDEEGLKAYAQHPEHQKCIELTKKIVATRRVIDFTS